MTAIILPFPEKNPWEREPNQVSYRLGNYHLFVNRHPQMLHLCGYVGVTSRHPLYGVSSFPYDERLNDLYAHGGITYTNAGGRIPGMHDGLWYFGFDAAHAGDYIPGLMRDLERINKELVGPNRLTLSLFGDYESYRNIPFMKAEVERLCEQLRKIQREHNLAKYLKRMKRRKK